MIRFTKHAREEMMRRRIAPAWVTGTIVDPERSEPDPRNPGLIRSYRAIPAFGARVLRVVHRAEGDDILVITAHFDRGARR